MLHCQVSKRTLSFIIAAQASEAASVTVLSAVWGVSRSFRPVSCTFVSCGGSFSLRSPGSGVAFFLFCLSSGAVRSNSGEPESWLIASADGEKQLSKVAQDKGGET